MTKHPHLKRHLSLTVIRRIVADAEQERRAADRYWSLERWRREQAAHA